MLQKMMSEFRLGTALLWNFPFILIFLTSTIWASIQQKAVETNQSLIMHQSHPSPFYPSSQPFCQSDFFLGSKIVNVTSPEEVKGLLLMSKATGIAKKIVF